MDNDRDEVADETLNFAARVAAAAQLIAELRRLRAESFSRYSAWGGARAGFVVDWPVVAESIKSTRSM